MVRIECDNEIQKKEIISALASYNSCVPLRIFDIHSCIHALDDCDKCYEERIEWIVSG